MSLRRRRARPGSSAARPSKPSSYASDFKKVADEVLAPLAATPGVEMTVTVEIEATTSEGFDDPKVRTVSENAKTLKFEEGGFEEQ